MLRSVRKWIAIRRYAKRFGRLLRERYGKQKYYTPAQVKRTAETNGYNANYLCWALCMYCTRSDFDAYHQAHREACDYNSMRSEIADHFFGGDASFNANDVIRGHIGGDQPEFNGNFENDGDATSGGDYGGDSGGGGDGD